jgi:hypothetical protein
LDHKQVAVLVTISLENILSLAKGLGPLLSKGTKELQGL